MTNLTFPEAGENGAGHQLDLIAAQDDLRAIELYTDGAAVPLTMIRIAAHQLEPSIGSTWANALVDAAASVQRAIDNSRQAAQRAGIRTQAAMQAGEQFLAMHKEMEARVRELERNQPTP